MWGRAVHQFTRPGSLVNFLKKEVALSWQGADEPKLRVSLTGACGPCRFGSIQSYWMALDQLGLKDFRLFLLTR